LRRACELFGPRARVVASVSRADVSEISGAGRGATVPFEVAGRIRAMLARRPCTAQEVAGALGLRVVEVLKALDLLEAAEKVVRQEDADRTFFFSPGG